MKEDKNLWRNNAGHKHIEIYRTIHKDSGADRHNNETDWQGLARNVDTTRIIVWRDDRRNWWHRITPKEWHPKDINE